MSDRPHPLFAAGSSAYATTPSSIPLPVAGKRVGERRKKTAGHAPRRVVLTQPPHYGRVGAQITPPPRRSAAEYGAARAVQISHFEREYQVGRHGTRATVRAR